MTRRPFLLSLVLLATLSLACSRFFTTPIGDILDDPGGYEGKTVRISGVVVESANVIILKYYRVEDSTGRIAVVAHRAVPRRGAHVRVRGVVRQAFSIGDQSLTVIDEN